MTSAPVRDPLSDHLLAPGNAAFLLIDYQPAQIGAVRSVNRTLLLKNAVSTVRTIKAFGIPVVHSTINVGTGRGQPTLPELAELLEALPRHETAHGALLGDILDVLRGSSPAAETQPPLLDVEELSPGELRVLRYLPTNLSRAEIASELSVSPNTVNSHLRNIYAKLQVRDGSSAVQRARELRLLSAGRTG